MTKTDLSFTLNGRPVSVNVEPRTSLADCLREELLATGTHVGCEQGICGACTVFLDGRPTRSCITLASACEGADVRTVEGFDDDPLMARIRDAFEENHGLQCGFCTPGMVTTAYDIARRLPDADEERIRRELSGNICRCTGYAGIVGAIQDVVAGDRPAAAVQPLPRRQRPPSAATSGSPPSAAPAAEAPPPVASGVEDIAIDLDDLADGVRLSRELTVAASADKVWDLVRDLPRMAECIPGAAIDGPVRDGAVAGRIVVAIGPMKANFRGRGQTRFDDAGRTGSVTGQGKDGLSRSTVLGALDFRLAEAGPDECRLSLDMVYKLKGPLAQFGRPVLVEEIADRLLQDTAEALAARADGSEAAPAERRELSGIAFMAKVMLSLLKRLFRRR